MGEAETYLAAHTVDMILLDLGLPDCAGLEAIGRAQRAAPGVPLVVLTGLDDDEVATQALQQGAQDFLIKGQIDVRGLSRALHYAHERNRLERMKDEFVGTVSHELRTPLTSISGALGLLMTNAAGELPEPAKRMIAIAHSNCLRLVRLVNDILDMDKSGSGLVSTFIAASTSYRWLRNRSRRTANTPTVIACDCGLKMLGPSAMCGPIQTG